ncbi:Clp protease N-terminal domain-containing protein [Prevotellamassilia timonensis]|uniref:Clp protease N-terminal domain-containing protein n=1 Tax=Prevotellamassilia timonensis TaxID=1852370 RepID=UPI0040291FB7
MSYEIPAGTARIINKSKNIAIQFNLLRVSSLCLLLSAIENEQVLLILKKMNIDTEKLESEIKKVLSSHNELVGEENSVQPQTYNSDDIPLDADCTRVMKLVVLEDKLANGKKESSELVLLALLHDRQNAGTYTHLTKTTIS